METVPRPPHFLTWDCDHCHAPSDQWDWDSSPWPEDGGHVSIVCTSCAAALLALPEQQDAIRQALQSTNRQVRRYVNLPYGTLIVCREDFGSRAEARQLRDDHDLNDRGHRRSPGLLYGVVVDAWSDVWPVDEWVEWPEGGILLFLGGFVFAGPAHSTRDIPAGWLILRSLERPADQPLCIPVPADFSPTHAERKPWDQARAAFFELQDRRGRPPKSGRFETAEDFEWAVFAAVAALWTEKRNITQKAVGAHLIAKRGRNRTSANDSPADPGRQFREWCKRFGFSAKDLLQRAKAACASGA